MYIKRDIEELVQKTEKGCKAVLITGVRQVGKATLLKHIYGGRNNISDLRKMREGAFGGVI